MIRKCTLIIDYSMQLGMLRSERIEGFRYDYVLQDCGYGEASGSTMVFYKLWAFNSDPDGQRRCAEFQN